MAKPTHFNKTDFKWLSSRVVTGSVQAVHPRHCASSGPADWVVAKYFNQSLNTGTLGLFYEHASWAVVEMKVHRKFSSGIPLSCSHWHGIFLRRSELVANDVIYRNRPFKGRTLQNGKNDNATSTELLNIKWFGHSIAALLHHATTTSVYSCGSMVMDPPMTPSSWRHDALSIPTWEILPNPYHLRRHRHFPHPQKTSIIYKVTFARFPLPKPPFGLFRSACGFSPLPGNHSTQQDALLRHIAINGGVVFFMEYNWGLGHQTRMNLQN